MTEKLVDCQFVQNLIDQKIFTNQRYIILETSMDPVNSQECIYGAISIHPSYLEAGYNVQKYYPNYKVPEDGNVLQINELHKALAALGINHETLVLVYSMGKYSVMYSCRVVWALMYAGVKDVRMLDGGFEAWKQFNGKISSCPAVPTQVDQFNQNGDYNRQFLASTDDVKKSIDNNYPIIDIRSKIEFDGSFDSNYSFFQNSGHIPKAIHKGNWNELIHEESNKIKDILEIKQLWNQSLQISDQYDIIFYCGTGWRSSIGFFLAYMMGLKAKNYDSGFYGWSYYGNQIIKN